MKKFIIGVIVILILGSIASSCGGSSSNSDDWGASVDWGPDHYWDSGSGSVKEKAW